MKKLELLLYGIIAGEALYAIYLLYKNYKTEIEYKESIKKVEETKSELSKSLIDKLEIERKIDEKNFKFLAINQMAKTLAKEKSIASLQTLIMDMLLEVNSVSAGISFENREGVITIYEAKNIENLQEFSIDKYQDSELWKYIKENRVLELDQLKKFEKTKWLANLFKEGYFITFSVYDETGEEDIAFAVLLGDKSYGSYSEGDGEFFETLSGQIEIILENAKKNSLIEAQNSELTERVYDLMTLNNAAKMISSTLDIDEIFKSSVDMFTEVGQSSKGAILYYEKEADTLIVKALKGDYDSSVLGRSVKLERNLIEYLRKNQGGIILSELRENDDRILLEFYRENREFFKYLKSEVLIPLIANEEFIGIILLGMRYMGDGYKRDGMDVFVTLGSQVAVSTYNAKLYNMAITDGMTKLYLHRYFQSRFDEELERTKRYQRNLSVIMIDIDHFKKFNDTYGHQTGDEVLKMVAGVIKTRARKSDICARYGGEEFAVILPETGEDGGVKLGEYIRKEIEEAVLTVDNKKLRVTISLGVSCYSVESALDLSKEELIKRADKALYKSKESGRNRVTRFSDLKEESLII